MLQRIQSVYLMIITLLMILMLFMPLAGLQLGETLYSFDAMGVSTVMAEQSELVYPAWGLLALIIVIALISLVTIFLFRNRILQMRLCVFNAFLMLGFYAFFGFLLWKMNNELGEGLAIAGKIAATFPFVSLVLNYLAIRNIGADEALVRSLDRLR